MWSLSDEQELLVRADALMHAGDARGEIMARELQARIARQVPRESTPCIDDELAAYLREHAWIEARLEAGVMVSAKLSPRSASVSADRQLELAVGLLSLEGSRWLRHLQLDAFVEARNMAFVELLSREGLVARPRVIVIGAYPATIRCGVSLEQLGGAQKLGVFAEPDSGLHTLILPGRTHRYSSYDRSGRLVELPWAQGDKHRRERTLGELHARAKSEGKLSRADFTRCVRALWDPSRRIRKWAVARLHLFGREVAQALPEAMLSGSLQGCAMSFPADSAARLRAQTEVVEVLAANYGESQLHAAKWTLVSPKAASIARDRAESLDGQRVAKWAKTLRVPRHVDLNEASAEELMLIPGIGPAYSRRILAYRARRSFESIEELREIPGIGPRVYTHARLWLHVGPTSVTRELGARAGREPR